MANKQRYHGILLAANSVIENAHVERLAADPLVTQAGRFWYNTTDKVQKFSTLDTGGAVVVKAIVDADTLQEAITTLQTALAAETSARTAADSAEVTARQAAISTLTQQLADETAARIAADTAETQARTTADQLEATARANADAAVQQAAADALATETAARLAGDAAATTRMNNIQAEVDATQVGAGLSVLGAYVPDAAANYIDAAATLKEADQMLDTALKTEADTRLASDAALQSAITNEAQLRLDGDTALQTQLEAWVTTQIALDNTTDEARVAAEAALRIAKDNLLQAELDTTQAAIGLNTDGTMAPITSSNYMNAATTVFGAAFALDVQIKQNTDAIATEAASRTTADTTLQSNIDAANAARTAGDAALQSELNTTQAGAGLEATGAYAALTGSNYLNAAISLKDADVKLDAAAQAISSRVTVVETVSIPQLQTNLANEVTRAQAAEAAEATARANADTTLTTNLNNEITARTAGDAALQTAIDNEVTARTSAITSTNAAIATETTNRQSADTNLQGQIDAIVAASGSGAAALKTSLNAQRFNYSSASATLIHNINHNLGTDQYIISMLIKGNDGIWRNDVAPLEVIDTQNHFRIFLSEAADVKVSVISTAAIA